MKRIALSLVAILLFASCVHADWQSTFSYDASVAISPSGPFLPNAIVFSDGSPPTHIDVSAQQFHSVGGNDLPDGVQTILASSSAFMDAKDFSSMPHSPFFIKVSIHDKASGLTDSVVLNGSFDLINGVPVPSFNGSVKRQIGDRLYDVTSFPPIPGFPPGHSEHAHAPGDPIETLPFQFVASITSTEVAPTPEPTTIFMAFAGIFGIGVVRKRIELQR